MDMLFENADVCHHKIRIHEYDDTWVGKYNHESHGIQRGLVVYNSFDDFDSSHYKELFPQSSPCITGWEEVYVKLRGRKVWVQARLLSHQLRKRYIV